MDPNTLTQLGLGGVIALLLVREVLGFLKTRRHDGTNGEAATAVINILQQQTKILDELRVATTRQTEILLKSAFIEERIEEGQVNVRESLHDLRNQLQRIIVQANRMGGDQS